MYTCIWVHSSRFSSRSVRSCCSHFYCITSLNLNRAEPSFGSHGCSPGSHWHLAALLGWLSATRKHSQTKKTHTHMHTHTGRAKATCSWPFPRSCSELFARLSLSLSLSFSDSLFTSSPRSAQRERRQRLRRSKRGRRRQRQRQRRSPACVSIIFCRAWHWKRDKRAENNVPIPDGRSSKQ